MKPATIKRFSIAEIVLHWSQAIPYTVLFCTGVAMLLQRLLGAEVVRHDILSMVHRVAGFVLVVVLVQTLVVSIICGSFRDLLRKMRKCLSWGLRDLIWLAKTSSNAVEPGKKLRLIRLMSIVPGLTIYSEVPLAYFTIVTLVPGFIASGLAMMLVPGALGLWVIHLALFVPACLCLGLHLFRTLLYHRKLLTQTMVAIVFSMIAVGAVWLYGHQRLKGRAIELRVHRGADIINPGPLTASHDHDPKLKRCTSCHQLFSPIPSEKCLSCHDIIQQRMAQQSGFHGKLTGQCRSCHRDHIGEDADIRNFDATQFDHNLAAFKLQGTHSKLPCSKCHLVKADKNTSVQTKYIGFPTTCDKCHANIKKLSEGIARQTVSKPDPHAGRVACTQCHQTDKQKQKPADYANKCKSCHTDRYEQLYYDWSTAFDMRALHAEKLLLKLSDEDALQSTHLTEGVKEANETGFHNIDLANKLWNQIFSETPVSNE